MAKPKNSEPDFSHIEEGEDRARAACEARLDALRKEAAKPKSAAPKAPSKDKT